MNLARTLVQIVAVTSLGSLVTVAVGCSPDDPSRNQPSKKPGNKEVDDQLPEPPDVQSGIGVSCTSDQACDYYLRCDQGKCVVPPAVDGAPASAETPAVSIIGKKGEAQFHLELALDPKQRARGLMYRPRMSDQWAMLFVYPNDRPQSFWMKNTFIPLDMVFINDAGKVVGVVANAEPKTLGPRKVDGTKSRYVLEINAGLAEQYGIEAGSTAHFTRLPPGAAPRN